MPLPKLPAPDPGAVPLVCTCYDGTEANWGDVLQALGGRRDGATVVLDDGGVRLGLVEHPRWDHLPGGVFPALAEGNGGTSPVVLLADIPAVYGGDAPLAVDLRHVPGRGVRIAPDDLSRVLAGLLDGTLHFDELVRGMDRFGTYGGDQGPPALPTATTVIRTSFPALPATDGTLLIRTGFGDDQGWCSLLDRLREPDEFDMELMPRIVDDRAFENLQPGQVPALVPPGRSTTMVVLADAEAMAAPLHRLLAVDLYDTPGQALRIPCAKAATMAANLEIGNLYFAEFG